jgi:hypothetical protein
VTIVGIAAFRLGFPGDHVLAVCGTTGSMAPLFAAFEFFGSDPFGTTAFGIIALASLLIGLFGFHAATGGDSYQVEPSRLSW